MRLAGGEEMEIADHDPFLGQIARARRHRAGRDAADLGMMGPAGGEESQLALRGREPA